MTSLSRTGNVMKSSRVPEPLLVGERSHRDGGYDEEAHERWQVEKQLIHRDAIDLPEASYEEVSGHPRNEKKQDSQEEQRPADDDVRDR